MEIRPLVPSERPELEALLMREPAHNLFHLSALVEHGLGSASEAYGSAWAVGAYRENRLVGAVVALRGTVGLYHTPGDGETLHALADVLLEKSSAHVISLLSGHASQIEPVLPLVDRATFGGYDRCLFRTLLPDHLVMPRPDARFAAPQLATAGDIERLIDFYMVGFYSLAQLPTRAAWRARLYEQLTHRTLYFVEDESGTIISTALSSAEGGGAAMLGGVATLEEYRGRGLSPLCVSHLCAHLFGRGFGSVSLFYLIDNLPAGRVYEKLGFHAAGEWLLVSLGY